MEKIKESEEKLNMEETVSCLFFDGRRDKTTYMVYSEETNKYYRDEVVEEHYSLTVEPSGRYVDHFVPEEASGPDKHAKQIAKYIVRWVICHILFYVPFPQW